jgi:hypothetical protein
VKLHENCLANPISVHDKKGSIARRIKGQLEDDARQRVRDGLIKALHGISAAASKFF